MRILVTGSAGSIGRVLSSMLMAAGHHAQGLGRLTAADFFSSRSFRISRMKERCASGAFDARLLPRPAAA